MLHCKRFYFGESSSGWEDGCKNKASKSTWIYCCGGKCLEFASFRSSDTLYLASLQMMTERRAHLLSDFFHKDILRTFDSRT